MEMLQCMETKYGPSMRSEPSYSTHPYLPNDPVLPKENEQTPHPNFASASSQSKEALAAFSQSNYFAPNRWQYQQSSFQNPFYPDKNKLVDPLLEKSSGPLNTDLDKAPSIEHSHTSTDNNEPKQDKFQNPPSRDPPRDDKNQSEESLSKTSLPLERNKDTSSPLSNESLSDSEVPPDPSRTRFPVSPEATALPEEDKDGSDALSREKQDNYKQAGYYKEYLKRYSEAPVNNNTEDKAPAHDSECPDSQTDNCPPDAQTDADKPEARRQDPELEEAVKKELDEVIRQHNLRITQPLRDHETSQSHDNPPATPDLPPPGDPLPGGQTSPVSTSVSVTPHGPQFASPQLSPFAGSNPALSRRPSIDRPQDRQLPDFQRADSDPLSPRAAHIRHLQFSGDTSPPSKRDFGPLGPGFPPVGHGGPPGIPIPNPYHHQLNQLADLHIQRSRANTVPATDLIARPRSDSFSSLPEGRRKRDGADYYYCHLCSYVGTTDFHFQAHMNSHFEHQCPHCDYKSRTEGRLKRHIKDFHTEDNPADFTGGRIMRREPGKPKLFRCRQCDFVAQEKEEYWKHARSHIKDDKCLQCPKCPFVTEYKHHLEYHLRNHFGSKPFKCNKCNYSCVNKSMLNSHMKSHTNVYQYRCADCTYATKYCHSLKLHLHKYNHKPAMVLNSDGSLPNDGLGDFDLVAKRGPPRGPRSMKRESCSPPGLEPVPPGMLAHLHPGMGPSNPLNGMQAMMAGFWPHNGVAPPPPLIPVGPMGPHMGPNHKPIDIRPLGGAAGRGLKCQLCEFSTENPHMLMEHTIRIHGRSGAEQHFEMMDMHRRREAALQQQKSMEDALMRGEGMGGAGGPQDSLESMRLLAQNASKLHAAAAANAAFAAAGRGLPDDYPRSLSPPSPLTMSSPPPHDNPLNNDYSGFSPRNSEAAATPMRKHSGSEGETKQNGERPLDLTSVPRSPPLKRSWYDDGEIEDTNFVKDSGSNPTLNEQPHSAASAHSEGGASIESAGGGSHYGESQQEDSHSRPTSPVPRKRSRKGNPFKLDAISMKLQTRYPGTGTDEGGTEGSTDDNDLHARTSPLSSHSEEHSNPMHNIRNKDDVDSHGHNMENGEGPHDKNTSGIDLDRKLNRLIPKGHISDVKMSHDSQSPPTPTQNDNVDQPESIVDSAQMYFSASIDRRKMLERFSRSQDSINSSSTPNGRIYRSHDLDFEAEGHTNDVDLESKGDEDMHDELERDGAQKNDIDQSKWEKFTCHHCGIAFQDIIMYTIHSGYHGFKDPFKCNMCGTQTHDKVDFFLHIARTAHS